MRRFSSILSTRRILFLPPVFLQRGFFYGGFLDHAVLISVLTMVGLIGLGFLYRRHRIASRVDRQRSGIPAKAARHVG